MESALARDSAPLWSHLDSNTKEHPLLLHSTMASLKLGWASSNCHCHRNCRNGNQEDRRLYSPERYRIDRLDSSNTRRLRNQSRSFVRSRPFPHLLLQDRTRPSVSHESIAELIRLVLYCRNNTGFELRSSNTRIPHPHNHFDCRSPNNQHRGRHPLRIETDT